MCSAWSLVSQEQSTQDREKSFRGSGLENLAAPVLVFVFIPTASWRPEREAAG